MKTFLKIALASTVMLFGLGTSLLAQRGGHHHTPPPQPAPNPVIVVAPPPPPPVIAPPTPCVGAVWVPGQWVWNSYINNYAWQNGYWVQAPPPPPVCAPHRGHGRHRGHSGYGYGGGHRHH